ncbi:MAG: efflux RND transporter permease subunit [Saprospiraceae bacterium]|nr:efflux RND transporter permease subunit [Saprospiraceae bacterium]
MNNGVSGRIAAAFMQSKLTILLMVAMMAIGVYSTFLIPREEEPQINVPMADIMIGYPGASPQEIENRVIKPIEKVISNLQGVDHIHSMSMNGKAMIIVQFYVGEDTERSYVNLYNELMKNDHIFKNGIYKPLVKTRTIDDVPMLGITLWSETYDDHQILMISKEVENNIKKIKGVSTTQSIGGRNRQVKVILNKELMAQNKVDPLRIIQMIKANNTQFQSGKMVQSNQEILLNTGNFLERVEDVENLVVGVYQNMPIYLKQVAQIQDGPEDPKNYVSFGYGKSENAYASFPSEYNATTISVSKIKGADAMSIAEVIIQNIELLKKDLIPNDVHVEITRNYGETASHKVGELLLHLAIAIIAVTFLVVFAMGWKGGLVVFLSVPLTFALTLFSYYIMDYTLNRITLFALVFVVGIVVDDSIIIAENMHRHFKMRKLPFKQAALFAINEVGNPTILATFTVIAAILPMAFVSGMMGPYMSPMPIGASIAMILSLFVALTITPYLGFHFLREKNTPSTDEDSHAESDLKNNLIYKIYNKLERPLLDSSLKRWILIITTLFLLIGSMFLFLNKTVAVKMLPFDNKNEFQIVIDMPEGTTLETTSTVTKEIAQYISKTPEVINYQNYVGASAPITFNGLVRHYDLRGGSNMADIQVNLTHKEDRNRQSHEIAKSIREPIQKIGAKYGANVKVIEVPPGPPVLSTIVAEVYGPDYEGQQKIASQVMDILHNTKDVVDIDWMVEAEQSELNIRVDREKAMLYGISPMQITQTVTTLFGKHDVSTLYDPSANDPVGIVLTLDEVNSNSIQGLNNINITSSRGTSIPIMELVDIEEGTLNKTIYRKDQKRVVYVTADMAGELESPVYAILGMEEKLKEITLPAGYQLQEKYMGLPDQERDFTVKWDGEWQITLEVFRDLGAAFIIVILIIYMLIVGWFENFKTPFVMMLAIPLSLIGIVLGHWILDAYFTATSFIGMIALAGVMVRNSVLLIDFIEIRLKEGIGIKDAIIDAGAVRTTPILLTTGAVVIGASIILFDPIFQGLAISLVAGAIVSTILTLLVVPLIYYMTEKNKSN